MYMGIALGLHRTTILKALNYADVVQKLDKKYQRVIGGAAKTFQTKKLPSQSHQQLINVLNFNHRQTTRTTTTRTTNSNSNHPSLSGNFNTENGQNCYHSYASLS